MGKVASDILELVGGTPLVKINRLNNGGSDLYAKLEASNPGFCVKDRIAKAMIDDAIADGRLKPGMNVIEPTSGNTGIGLAMTCAVRGYKVTLVMPDTMSAERRQILKVFGAELVLTPGAEGMPGAIRKAEELVAQSSDSWMPQQFNNPSNPKVHRETTAEEIWNDTDGEIDIIVGGVGTGGTITGCAEVLKQKKSSVKAIAVEPINSAVMSGEGPGKHKVQGIGAGFIPTVLNMDLIDEVEKVTDEEAGETARALAIKEGIFCGISSGAAMAAAIKVAENPENAGKKIVVVLPDTGERYLSTWLFEEYRC
ncbi:MAG: cysteine synthase A [Lentisphaeraceae bacterium]|nr:cysteine synthase A [Lentisphaeraceae bacterium]